METVSQIGAKAFAKGCRHSFANPVRLGRSICELGQHRASDAVLAVPADDVGFAEAEPEIRKQLGGKYRTDARIPRRLAFQAHQQEQTRAAQPGGALPFNLEEVP